MIKATGKVEVLHLPGVSAGETNPYFMHAELNCILELEPQIILVNQYAAELDTLVDQLWGSFHESP